MATEAKPAAAEIRRAVFGGMMASLWATGGWLAWLFGKAVLEDWTAIFGPMVGALIGLLVHAAEHYRHVAHFEKHGGVVSDESPEEEPPPRRFGEGLGRSALLLALAFVALTCEHVLGELTRDFFVPFLASVATLLPVGAFLTLAFGDDDPQRGTGASLLGGLIVGLLAGFVASLVQGAIGGGDYGAIFSWWVVLCLGLGLAAGKRSLRPLRALWGVGVALAIVAFFCFDLPMRMVEKIPVVQIRGPIQMVGAAVTGSLASPEMPARFWLDAERKEEAHRARQEGHGGDEEPRESGLGRWLAGLTGYEPPRHMGDEGFTPTQRIDRMLAMGGTPYKTPEEERRYRLWRELLRGWDSGLVRSWLVMALFAFGLGLGPIVEEGLRPKDYPSSRTARNDRILFAGVALFVAAACLALRFLPSHSP